ncbi:hypothetical protein V1520DRAFT_344200 [Lipomyces starkeyi]
MILEKLTLSFNENDQGDSSDKTDHYAAFHKRGWGIFFGAGGTVFFGILAYEISLVLNTYSVGAGASAGIGIGIFVIGAMCAAISAGLAAEDRSTSVDGID